MSGDYQTIDIRIQTANKRHYCNEYLCKSNTKSIKVGEKYVVIKFIDREDYPDTVLTHKTHLNCLEFVKRGDIAKIMDKKKILYKEHDDGYCRIEIKV